MRFSWCLLALGCFGKLPESLCPVPEVRAAQGCKNVDCARLPDSLDAAHYCEYSTAKAETECLHELAAQENNKLDLSSAVECRKGQGYCEDMDCFSTFWAKVQAKTAALKSEIDAKLQKDVVAPEARAAMAEKKVSEMRVGDELQKAMDQMDVVLKQSQNQMSGHIEALPEALSEVKSTVPEYLSALRSEISSQVKTAKSADLEKALAERKVSEVPEPLSASQQTLADVSRRVEEARVAREAKEQAQRGALDEELKRAKKNKEQMVNQIREEVEMEVRSKMKEEKARLAADERERASPAGGKKGVLSRKKGASLAEVRALSSSNPRPAASVHSQGTWSEGSPARKTKDEVAHLFETSLYMIKSLATSTLEGVFGETFLDH